MGVCLVGWPLLCREKRPEYTRCPQNHQLLYQLAAAVPGLHLMATDYKSPPRMQIARELQVALVLDWGWLGGFRQAFDPAQIRWDVDHTQFYTFAADLEQGEDSVRAAFIIACHHLFSLVIATAT